MGRFLFVVPPIIGHLLPTLAVGRELQARGHEVAWAGHDRELRDALPEWATFIVVAERVSQEVEDGVTQDTRKAVSGLAAFVKVWRTFVLPVARQMVPGVHAAIDSFRPDVVVVDQQTPAGAVVAEVRGLPWATTATTPIELMAYYGEHHADQVPALWDPTTVVYLNKLRDWLQALLRDLSVEMGLDPVAAETFNPRISPRLVVAFTTLDLLNLPADAFPDHFALVGPSIGDRPPVEDFPWEWLIPGKPLVYISLGTINWRGGSRFFEVAAEALAPLDVQAVLVAPASVELDPPPNMLVREKVPQVELLDRVDVVVNHAGQNTVSEALAAGRPMVLAPIRDDQPLIAEQVTRAGAALTVRFSRVTADELRDAITSVLTDKRFRAAAERIQASFETAGGPPEAADRLEAMLATSPPASP